MSSTRTMPSWQWQWQKPSCLPGRIMLMKSLVNSSELTYLPFNPEYSVWA
jgi:hypothetical protein